MSTPTELYQHHLEQEITKTLLQFSCEWIARSDASETITQRAIELGQDPGPYLSLLFRILDPGYQTWTLSNDLCVIDLGFTQITLRSRSYSVRHSRQAGSPCGNSRIDLDLIFHEIPRHQGFNLADWMRKSIPWINGLPVFGVTVENLRQSFSFESLSRYEITLIFPRVSLESINPLTRFRVPMASFAESMITSPTGLPPASRFIDEWEARSPLSSPPSELGRVSSEELRGELGEGVERSLEFPLVRASNASQRWIIERSGDFLEATVTRVVDYNGYRTSAAFERIAIADLNIFTYERSQPETTQHYIALKLKKALPGLAVPEPSSESANASIQIQVDENFLVIPGSSILAQDSESCDLVLPARILLNTEDHVWIVICIDSLLPRGVHDFSCIVNEPDLNGASDSLMRVAVQVITAPRDPASSLDRVRRFLREEAGSVDCFFDDLPIREFTIPPTVTFTDFRSVELAEWRLPQWRSRHIHAEIAERLRAAEAMRKPTICRGCKYHCGQTNNGRTLVCAVHPNGPAEPDSCVDFEAST